MARRGRKCVVADCPKVAAVGSVVCQEHRDTTLGEQTDREIMKMTRRLEAMAKYEEGEEKRDAMREFRRQVLRGDYAAMFSSEMVQALNDEGRGYGLKMEIGMMRVAMMRLMLEEENPSRLAHSLAKLSGALGKSMERQEEWEKADRARKMNPVYWDMAYGRTPKAIEEGGVQKAPGTEVDVVVEQADAAIERWAQAVDGAEPQEESEFKPLDWPRAGYPDYYVDVEEYKKWGTEAGEPGDSGEPRIARGK